MNYTCCIVLYCIEVCDEKQVTVTPNLTISFKLIYGRGEIQLNWFVIGILPICNASEDGEEEYAKQYYNPGLLVEIMR